MRDCTRAHVGLSTAPGVFQCVHVCARAHANTRDRMMMIQANVQANIYPHTKARLVQVLGLGLGLGGLDGQDLVGLRLLRRCLAAAD